MVWAALFALNAVKVKINGEGGDVKLVRSKKELRLDCKMFGKMGEGACGTVHYAEYRGIKCVAKKGKVMEGETESDALDRIVREALNLYKVNGAGGAPRLWALARDAPIFIMSLCEGKDLTHIHYSKNFSEKKLSQIFLSIGISLSELHAAGCVHNDIKRNNLVIGKNPDKTFKAHIIDL